MNSPEVRAAADLAALLPTDHPLAQLGRLRLDAAVRRTQQETRMTETPDEQRTRQVTQYADTHTPTGHFIPDLNALKDKGEPACEGCGRHLPPGAPSYQHAIECPNYVPHPASLAAHQANPDVEVSDVQSTVVWKR